MSRRWIIPLAALALLVPVGAVALDRGSTGLEVESSLEECGVAGDTVFCHISASFNRLGGGEFYTASVTRPDSTVQDFGQVATGADGRATTSLWVPFAGNGAYTVEITAWARDAEGEPTEVAKEQGKSGSGGEEAGELAALQPDSLPPLSELDESGLLPACDSTGDQSAPAGEDEGAPVDGSEPPAPDEGLGEPSGSGSTEDGGPGGGDSGEGAGAGGGGDSGGGAGSGDSGSGAGEADGPGGGGSDGGPSDQDAADEGSPIDLAAGCDEPAEDVNGPCCPDAAPSAP